ncbi:MAG: hypothetical protein F7C34_02785 [Desulfurococcales archaeon]|nr:hypothetical protein [Desulfurococcales archaeon]
MGITVRDALSFLVEMVSKQLIDLSRIGEELDSYKITSTNTLSLSKDASLVEKLEATVDIRLKLVEFLTSARKYIVRALEEGGEEDLLKKLGVLAQYYVYAGVRLDRRVANRFGRLIVVEGLKESIDSLYNAFADVLDILGIEIVGD